MTSTAIYTCYRQLHPPTGVDHAVFGSVTAAGSRDLVVAKASTLELYRVHRDDHSSTAAAAAAAAARDTSNGDERDDDDASGYYLELAGTFPLAGNITALAVIPVATGTSSTTTQQQQQQQQQQQDILVVSFGVAKMALVAYDSVLGRLETISIHNFDAGAIGPGAGGVESGYGLAAALKDRPRTISSSDPAGRCLAAVVAGCQLVVLPARRHVPGSVFVSEEAKRRQRRVLRLRRRAVVAARRNNAAGAGESAAGGVAGGVDDGSDDDGDDDGDDSVSARESDSEGEEDGGLGNGATAKGDGGAGGNLAVSKPFTIDLEEAGITGFIKAAAFLEGFHEPALALLYEPIQTCAGRLASKRSTCRLALLSINLTQGRAPVIWQVENLPHDSWDLVPVPSPIGGLQVISTNAVMHVNQSEVRSILAVNGYARATVDPALLECPLRGGDSDWGWTSFRRSHPEREVVDLSSYDVCIELDVVRCAFLTPTSMLLSLRTGEVYALRLHLTTVTAAAADAAGCSRPPGGAAFGTPNRVVGQSMRPVGRASPCSVLAVAASGGSGGDGGSGASKGLVFMGSRVGDSLLVDYSVASAGTRPGGKGAAVPKREPKAEEEEEEEDVGQTEGAPAARSSSTTGEKAAAGAAAVGQQGETSSGGAAAAAPAAGAGAGATVKEEVTEGGGGTLAGMQVDANVGSGDGSAAMSTRSPGGDGKKVAGDADADGKPSEITETSGGGAEIADGPGAVTSPPIENGNDGSPDPPAATPTKQEAEALSSSPQPDDGEEAGEGKDAGSRGGSAKRGRAERPSSGGDVGAGDNDGQPDKKRSRVSACADGEDDAASSGEAVPATEETTATAAAAVGGAPASTAVGGEEGAEALGDGVAAPTVSSESGRPAAADAAIDPTPPPPTTAPAVMLSKEEQEMIEEEEQLYGARIGASASEGADGSGGEAALARLGSKDGERVIEAVGFRLKVVDSICTLGPIVDAALVPSAYHVPKTTKLAGGGGGNRSRGGHGGRGSVPNGAAAAAAAVAGGGTSGGGIRTSLVCAAGYGGQGSLAVFSAGLRTEVVVELSVPGATGVYSSSEGGEGGGGPMGGNKRDTLVLVSCSASPPAAAGAAAAGGDTRAGHTRVLAFEEDAKVVELPEGDGNPFVCDAATADVCSMAGGTVVQAHKQGLRVTRNRDPVQDVLASEDPDLGGLGADAGVTVLRAAAAGSHACCLLSNLRLHLMALDDGDLMPVGSVEEAGEEGEGGGGVWEEVEAVCMFGVQEPMAGPPSRAVAPASAAASSSDVNGCSSSGGTTRVGLFLERARGESREDEQEEEEEEEEDLGAGLVDDEDEDDFDDDGGKGGGYDSEEEEWAALYSAEPGRSILNPCANGGGGGGGGQISGAAAAAASGSSNDTSAAGGVANGQKGGSVGEQSPERYEEEGLPAQKGWWGGSAWGEAGGSGSEPTAPGDDGEEAGSSNGEARVEHVRAYVVVCRRGGTVEVFSCEGEGAEETRARPVFRATGAALAPPTLWNELLLPPAVAAAAAASDDDDEEEGSSLAKGGGRGSDGNRSPMNDDVEEEEAAGGLAVATGIILANGRRGAAGRGGGKKVDGEANGAGTAAPSSDPMEVDDGATAPDSAAVDASASGEAPSAPDETVEKAGADAGGAAAAAAEEEDSVVCPAVTDVIVHPVGAVGGPPELRRLVLAMHLDNGSLLVYEARMVVSPLAAFGGREQVVCFSKLSHDLITRPVKGVPPEAALFDPGRGRALRGVRSAAGQEGVCFARPGCRSALILAERGAVCVSAIAQDDLGDGSGAPPLPPGAPPSWAGIGLGSLAPLYNPDAFPGGGGGGFAGVTAGGGRIRFISAAPAASQLVNPGTSGGGGLGGGGQGHFVAEKVRLGATVHGLVHLPHDLAHAGKTGDILKQLLRARGHYVALVSTMEDALVAQPKSGLKEGEEGEQGDGDDDEEEEAAGLLDRHTVKHKNWTVADPSLGGAPPLLVPRFELRVLALAPGAVSAAAATSSSAARSPSSANDKGGGGGGTPEEGEGRRSGGRGQDGSVPGNEAEALMLSAAVVESHPMDSDENGVCMTLVRLEQGGAPRMYVAVGTGMNEPQGEDKAARGRLILLEVDYAYLAREDGKHEHAVKLRQVFAKEQLGPVSGESGPVSAVAQLGRHLILSVGKKVIVNRWDPKTCTLELIGFHDPRVYVMSLSVIKHKFILVGDAYGSVQLVVWREEDHSLTALSKDHEDCQVFSAEYLIDEPGMAIVVADGRRNVKVLQYAPNATNSRGGTKLLCQSDFYLGSRVGKLTRRRTRGNLRDGARYCLLAGTLDGGLGAVLPVDERVFRRLYALQGIMSNALGHNGAANPRAYRLFDHGPTFRYETKQNMLDGSLLWRFVGLDAKTQHDLTRAIGTTVDRVMANLLDIDLASLF